MAMGTSNPRSRSIILAWPETERMGEALLHLDHNASMIEWIRIETMMNDAPQAPSTLGVPHRELRRWKIDRS